MLPLQLAKGLNYQQYLQCSARCILAKMEVYRKTDQLLFGIFTKLFFWNTKLFFKKG